MTGNLFLLPIFVVLFVMAIGGIAMWHSSTPTTRYANLRAARERDGLSPDDFDAEITLRVSAVEFRRAVSLAVLSAPTDSERIIREMAKEETMLIAAVDKAVAKRFIDWIEGASLSEILLPTAYKAVWQAVRATSSTGKPSPALIAALKP